MRTLLACLGPFVLLLIHALPADAGRRPSPPDLLQTSSTAGYSKAMPDSFILYGGPGSVRGKFQDAAGNPTFDSWTSVDLTQQPGGDFVGDFAKVAGDVPSLGCVGNESPVVHFIDDGTPPNNAPGQSTGGETGTWTYAGFVVNRSGGLSTTGQELANEIQSPPILWDDPGTIVDNGMDGGLTLRFDVYEHLPQANGIFYTWSVRSFTTFGGWSRWIDRGLVYYNENPGWQTRQFEVGDLLVPNLTMFQVALGVVDLSTERGLPGTDSTPAPYFDNVTLIKHQVGGPFIWGLKSDVFQDGFPTTGAVFDTTNLSTQAIRLDIARDINEEGALVVPGDSLVVNIVPAVPGTILDGPPRLVWFLVTNPLFDSVRVIPSGATLLRPRVWKGTVFGQQPLLGGDQWFFDLPDGPPRLGIAEPAEPPFFFPGDVFYFHVEATDSNLNTTSWLATNDDDDVQASEECGGASPAKPSQPQEPEPPKPHEPPSGLPDVWGDTEGKSPNKALPPGFHQPRILVWDDAGDRRELEALTNALGQNGLLFGRDYGVYSTVAPDEAHSNGLGGHHGATAAQLEFYDTLIYLGGALTAPLISDGSNTSGNDKGNDLGVLQAWRIQPADRAVIAFADNFGSALKDQGSSTFSYLRNTAGVSLIDRDVSDAVGTIAPDVLPESSLSSIFGTSFAVVGVCGDHRQFDQIEPLTATGAVASHRFYSPGGSPGPAAGVWRDRMVLAGLQLRRRVDATFPFGLLAIQGDGSGAPGSARSELLAELLTELGHPLFPVDSTPTPDTPRPELDVSFAYPNPFNPSTHLALDSLRPRTVEITVFDLKGRLVRRLPTQRIPAGRTVVTWDGRDDGRSLVASGTYFLDVKSEDRRETRKAVLVK